jgi:hypothetical protein
MLCRLSPGKPLVHGFRDMLAPASCSSFTQRASARIDLQCCRLFSYCIASFFVLRSADGPLLQMAQDVAQWLLAIDACMSCLVVSLHPLHQLMEGTAVVPDLLPPVLLQLAPLMLKPAAAAACATAGLEATQMEFRLASLVSALLFGSEHQKQITGWD